MPTHTTIYPGGVQAMLRAPFMIEAMRVRAARVKQRAQDLSPVRTGRYRGSWHYRSGLNNQGYASATVYNSVYYAGYLEFGTRYMHARRVLARAIAQVRR
jgi:HK97 gp10 family phage protein